MAIYLDEDMVATDAAMIAFPHLLLCMGVVVVLGDGSLVGAHFTQPTTEKALLFMMKQEVTQNGSGMDQLYCMADLNQHVTAHGGLDITGKAKGLGFTGPGYVADFGTMNPTDGTYAQVTSAGAGQRARVRCKLNEKMTYTNAPSLAARSSVQVVKLSSTRGNKMTSGHAWKIGANASDGHLNTPFLKPVTIT